MFNCGIEIMSGDKMDIIYKNPVTAAYGIIGYMFDQHKLTHDVFVCDERYINRVADELERVYYREYQIGADTIRIEICENLWVRIRIIER